MMRNRDPRGEGAYARTFGGRVAASTPMSIIRAKLLPELVELMGIERMTS